MTTAHGGLVAEEPAEEVERRECGREVWEDVQERRREVVLRLAVREEPNEEWVCEGRVVRDDWFEVEGDDHLGRGQFRDKRDKVLGNKINVSGDRVGGLVGNAHVVQRA